MSHYFFDSSALVKRYVPEAGSNWVRALMLHEAQHTILIAHITSVEVTSAAMRLAREQRISLNTAKAIRLLLHRHTHRRYDVIRLTDSIVQRAESLLESYPLRAYDSVQLATALEVDQHLIANQLARVMFVTADTRLMTIAESAGLQTDNPMAHL